MSQRPTRIVVDLDALGDNLRAIRAHVGVPVMGIVKANAYGHGLVPVARHLQAQGVEQLGVAFVEEGVALHEQAIMDWVEKRKTFAEIRPLMGNIGRKVGRQVLKDYIMWPLAALLVALPVSHFVPASPWLVFGLVAGANAVANIIRNIWAFMIIFCGHFPAGVHTFTPAQVDGETRAQWYLRQLLGSANIGGGKLFHILSGNLSHQIEHHLFPSMPRPNLRQARTLIEPFCTAHDLPYTQATLFKSYKLALGHLQNVGAASVTR